VNDFDIVIRKDFLKKAKVVLMFFVEKLVVFEVYRYCAIERNSNGKVWSMSAKRLKRFSQCLVSQLYVAKFLGKVRNEEMEMHVPSKLTSMLDEYEAHMLENFPKELPHKCIVGNHIKLELGAKPI